MSFCIIITLCYIWNLSYLKKIKLHSFRSHQQIYIPFICFCFHFKFGPPVFYVNLLFTKQLFMPSKTFSFSSVALLFCSLHSHILSIFSPFHRISQSHSFSLISFFRFLLLCFCWLKVYFYLFKKRILVIGLSIEKCTKKCSTQMLDA